MRGSASAPVLHAARARRTRKGKAGMRRSASMRSAAGFSPASPRVSPLSEKKKKKRLLKINIRNVRPAHTYTISEKVQHSPRVFAHLKNGKRFRKSNKSQSTEAVYDTDAGLSTTLASQVQRSTNFLRFGTGDGSRSSPNPVNDLQYDIDTGSKAGVATSVKRSQRTYPGMRSGTPRFKTPQRLEDERDLGPGYVDIARNNPTASRVKIVKLDSSLDRFSSPSPQSGANVYNTDQGVKATIATAVQLSARRYSPMTSVTPRSGGSPRKERHLTEALRNIDSNAYELTSLAHKVQTSNNQFKRLFDPETPRFSKADELGRDKEVAILLAAMDPPTPDSGIKASIAKTVAVSERRYSPMTSPTPRFPDARTLAATPPGLGPGAHNPKHSQTSRRPYSANVVQSRTPRFMKHEASHKSNSSYYTHEQDAKHWRRPGAAVYSSKTPQRAKVERPILDKEYNTDVGHKSTISTHVARSPNPHTHFKSKVARSSAAQSSACSPDLGPGSFSPVVLHHGKGATLASDPLSPGKRKAPGTWSRFTVTAKLDFSKLDRESVAGFKPDH